ncbi:Variant-specific surface protein, partial [Giardia duodenalis]
VCKTCAAGYFKNPANVETSDSCIACGDVTGVTVSGGATYKGVANCAACTAPAKAENGNQIATCTACVDGKYGADCTGNCNESCKSCNGAEATACTSCKTDNNKEYLKVTDPQVRTGECVDQATCTGDGTHFLVVNTKTCYPCSSVTDGGVADCQTCTSSKSGGAAKATTVTCSACTTPTKKPNADGTKCVDCAAAGCAKCSDEGVCAACDSSHYLTPTSQCVDKCDKLGGYYKDNSVCKPCSPECASCSTAGADKCLSCPAGRVLKYTSESDISGGGSCVDECTTGAGGCETCGAVIEGSKYCSKCNDASQAPLNGNCTANTARIQFCTNASNGACTQCANEYFLLDGGCYNISVAGSRVCREARDGACVMYAEENKTGKTSAGVIRAGAGDTCIQEATSGTPESTKCKAGKCDVTIGGSQYCSQCSTAAEYLIDGACVTDAGQSGCVLKSPTADGTCTQCGAGYFLHKGGCYQIGGTVGLLICDDKTATSGKDGICVSCHEGYFKNPAQAADKQSCIACSDTATVDSVKGVAGCATCNPPSSSGAATCLTCLDGYYNSGSESSVTCAECNAACATCSGDEANKCTSCKEADKYLKTDSSAGTSQCVTEADCKQGGTHFPTTTTNGKKICTLCSDAANGGIDGCTTCSKSGETVTCSACNNGKKPNKAGTKCFKCQVTGCSHCSKDGVCEACDGNKMSPGGSSFVTACPESSSEQSGACVCSSGFTPSGDSCVASSHQPQHRYHSRISVAVIAACSVLLIGQLSLQNEQSEQLHCC